MTVEVRQAGDADVPALAQLRWRSEQRADDDPGRAAFERDLVDWWAEHREGFRAVVALDGCRLVGMGFLALVVRVPTPDQPVRRHGDLQSMYVEEPYRGRGIGAAIVRMLLDLARDADCSRLEVHSGRRAVPFYERLGFQHLDRLMNHDLHR